MKNSTMRRFAALGLCSAMVLGAFSGGVMPFKTVEDVQAASEQDVQVNDLVIKFLGIPEYEPNRYTKSNGGKWAPEELEKGLLIKADMVLGEGNPEGMMAPMKHSLKDIVGTVEDNQTTGEIKISYNGLTLKMQAGKNTAELNDGKTTKTLTMDQAVAPYFKLVEGETNPDGSQYYACYLPVKFTAEALGGNVVWNEQMHRMEMAFAFYYASGAVSPIINAKSVYTTVSMEKDSNKYSTLSKRITVSGSQDSTAVDKNVADMVKAAVTVVNPIYQNNDGGWTKTNTAYDLLEDSFASLFNEGYSTIDNGATHGHIKFLARVIRLSKENPALFAAYSTEMTNVEDGFWKAVKWVMNAQTVQGGWAQYYPYGVGYFRNITFNDNAMPDVMELVYALTNDGGLTDSTMCDDFAWARAEIQAQTNTQLTSRGITLAAIQGIWDKALAFVIDSQVEIGGVVTGWAQQYDMDTGEPAGGRAFELPAVSPDESLTVVKVLTNIKNPSPAVRNSIKSYVDWIQTVGFTGYQVYTVSDRTRELAKDKLMVKDGSNIKQFGRFYGLDTTGAYYGLNADDKLTTSPFYEIFAGRDGVAQFTMNNGMCERRIGYSYLRTSADTSAMAVYNAWKTALGE